MDQSGPADCVDESTDDASANADAEQRDYEAGINSAGVIDGGVDDISALQLWDMIMKKYKVAQLCDEELRRLGTTKDDSDKQGLLRERALAVAAAVEALSKLQQKEVRNKLREHVEQENEVSRSRRSCITLHS